MLRVTKDREVRYLSIGHSCAFQNWDTKKNLPKRTHPLHREISILISEKTVEAQKFTLELANEQKDLSSDEIIKRLKRKSHLNQTLIAFFDLVISRMNDVGKIKNAEVYKDTKRNILRFTNGLHPHFSEVNGQFLTELEHFFKSNGKGTNTISIYFRTLRALFNKAILEEVCDKKYYPFNKFSLSKYSNVKTEKRAILKNEIEAIRNLDLSSRLDLIDARNIFLFSYLCRGMNFIDIALLQWKNIKNNRVHYRRKKTNEIFNIELLHPASQIISYYEPITFLSEADYIFPIIKGQHVSPTSIHNRRVKMLRKINLDLKSLGELAGIVTRLTTYVARHTYATVLKKEGISVSIIKEAMGHDSEKTTQIYLDSFENSILDNASRVII